MQQMLTLEPGSVGGVSRAGAKLIAALDAFGFDPEGRTALDVGASTGGFTEVLLDRGAEKVYAVDVGHDQLHARLRADPNVVSLEGCDARSLTRALIPDRITAVVADVSFISQPRRFPSRWRLPSGARGSSRSSSRSSRWAARASARVASCATRPHATPPSRRSVRGFPRRKAGGLRGSFLLRYEGDRETRNFCSAHARMGDTQALDIARLGAQGDGIAETPSGPVFVPYALPGEQVMVEGRGERARLVAVLAGAPERVAPQCRHFTHCGGCALQHLERGAYLAWKREQVAAAFAARGIEAPVAHVVSVGLGARRRATLSARRTGRGVVLGFHEAKGNDIVDLQECPVTASAIVRALPGLKHLVEPLASRRLPVRLTVTLAANGLDVAIEDFPGELGPEVRERLAHAAAAARLARVTLAGDTLYQSTVPAVRFGAANVVLPPRAFLQAAPPQSPRWCASSAPP